MSLFNCTRCRRSVWGLARPTLRVGARSTPATVPNCEFRRNSPTLAFTLVEMLVAMAITLVMMGAVVTLFANVSNSVRNRRATMEMSGQIRGVRNVLQQDLQGATCPGLTWQRPESNHGYIELIEGEYREGRASRLIDGVDQPDPNAANFNPEIDHALSILPSSNLPFIDPNWATDGAGLGDYDDILMLTVRNEHHPFVGRMPANVRFPGAVRAEPFDVDDNTQAWGSQSIESPLAEVIWFSIENPEAETASPPHRFFGEPGMRTIYRRTLLIAPWINPYRTFDQQGNPLDQFSYEGDSFKAEPGLVRLLPKQLDVEQAIAAITAFQDRYDLSVRLEWDHNIQRWKIMANTLGDLTKRENRFGHYGFAADSNPSNSQRKYAFAMISAGGGYAGSTADVTVVNDPEVGQPAGSSAAKAEAKIVSGSVISYTNDPQNYVVSPQRRYAVRPFAYVDKTSDVPATAQVILNDDGSVVRVVHGPVPLWGARRGEDVMLTDVLAFDLRVFDPAAPIFATRKANSSSQTFDPDVILTPSDPGWPIAYLDGNQMKSNGTGLIGTAPSNNWLYSLVGQGAYVDMGYGYYYGLWAPRFSLSSTPEPWFFAPATEMAVARALNTKPQHGGALIDVYGNQLSPGYSVYDTWSYHYENDGVDEDADGTIDEGTDGLEGLGHYLPAPPALPLVNPPVVGTNPPNPQLGVDDIGERETVPPYDKPLRGVQLIIRAYERDSRAIKQVRVNQHFMPE